MYGSNLQYGCESGRCTYLAGCYCSSLVQDHGITPEFTTEIITEIIAAADSADEVAAGADCHTRRKDQGGNGRESRA